VRSKHKICSDFNILVVGILGINFQAYGWKVDDNPELDWKTFMENKNKEIAR
jgi:hypothetical protein